MSRRFITGFNRSILMMALGVVLLLAACPDDVSVTDGGKPLDRFGFPADHPLLVKSFLNIAHRGGGRLAPEESLEAYQKAVAAGAGMLEMDLNATSDGVVVLHHDATVDRITDGKGSISGMTFEELRKLDAGFSYTTDGGQTYPYRGKGVRIATFREVLETFPKAIFSAEIKQSDPPIVDAVLAILAETGMEDRVILISFDDKVVRDIRLKNPRIVTGASLGEMMAFSSISESTAGRYRPPCPIFQLSGIGAGQLALAHDLDMKVQIWTVNDADEMRAWIEMGVDGIMTDDPALLETVLNEKGAR
ncbi:MAG: glycerophosphodiester phosphodiesterase [Myxococcota bacterium]|jgi:glycerophosphoryl diester phosphodiesterase